MSDMPVGDSAASVVRSRYGLARRVQEILQHLEDVESLKLESAATLDGGDYETGDFILQALDLRITILLMVLQAAGQGELSLALGHRAESIFDLSPNTDAVVFVFDDSDLTSVIIEPFDRPGVVTVPSGLRGAQTVTVGPAPLATAIQEYLSLLHIQWPPQSSTLSSRSIDLEETIRDAAAASLAEQRSQRPRVPEKIAARDSLNAEDEKWSSDLVSHIMRGMTVKDVDDILDAHLGIRP